MCNYRLAEGARRPPLDEGLLAEEERLQKPPHSLHLLGPVAPYLRLENLRGGFV